MPRSVGFSVPGLAGCGASGGTRDAVDDGVASVARCRPALVDAAEQEHLRADRFEPLESG